MDNFRHAAQYICTGKRELGEESDRPWEGIWKVWPDMADSMDDSTEGKGWRSDISGGGGVKALFNGDAVYD
jgi:hypothetical protein